MKDIRIAKRYAAALFEMAVADGIVDAVSQDLTLIERFLTDVPYLRVVLTEPLVSDAQKLKVAEDAFGDRVTASSLSFIRLLIRKRRERLIDECIRVFRALEAQRQNLLTATAYTAVPMTPPQEKALSRVLEERTGKRILLTSTVDAGMLGGVYVRMGDTIIDGTVRGRLQRLEQQLLGKRLPSDES